VGKLNYCCGVKQTRGFKYGWMYRFGAKRENYVLLLVAAAAEWASNTPCLRWKNNSVTLTVQKEARR
jgi:hypothetical protein